MWGSARAGAGSGGGYPSASSRELNTMFPSNSHLGRAEPRDTSHGWHTAVQILQTPARQVSRAKESAVRGKIASVVGFFTFNLIFVSVLHLSAALDL